MAGSRILLQFLLWVAWLSSLSAAEAPLRVLLAGLTHGHATGFFRQLDPAVLELAGVWEPDDAVWAKYQARFQLGDLPRFTHLSAALAATQPEAVWAFSDTRTHLAIVRAAAPRGVSVIVEKPLAVSWAAAAEMGALAQRHGTLVLTNYETSWYPSFDDVWTALAPGGPIGAPRHIYVQAGHAGPVKLGAPPEFLAWLRDPEAAGGGALFDFGCYGANLATWWLGNRAPESVTAHLSHFDPVAYPLCDDHATIQLMYADLQVTCAGSWHWSSPRKTAAIHGENATLVTSDDRDYTLRLGKAPAEPREAAGPARDAHRWLVEAIRAGRDPIDDPSSLANNLIVMRILEAARRSAAENRTLPWSEIAMWP